MDYVSFCVKLIERLSVYTAKQKKKQNNTAATMLGDAAGSRLRKLRHYSNVNISEGVKTVIALTGLTSFFPQHYVDHAYMPNVPVKFLKT